ncbi:MAG: sugar phosphate isomerase/epimerase [Phycisphaerales bacterium]|nr:sugar phosphate isomerase/epimerase [Phycisphaerales bacterium]
MTPRLGVCSWSLRPTDPADLAAKVRQCGVAAVQLALDPIRSGAWDLDETRAALSAHGIGILSGMMGMEGEDYSTLDSIRATGGVSPDDTWNANLAAGRANADLARTLGIRLVTFHAGFLPHDRHDPRRAILVDRLRQLAEVFADAGVAVAFETGQEAAGTLLAVLTDINTLLGPRTPKITVGVNFDPANMILYGMGDPVVALKALAPAVRQIHVKDALPADRPGVWGTEVPAGAGSVDWKAFFAAYKSAGLTSEPGVNLVIEREAGEDRINDVIKARRLIEPYFPSSAIH